MSVTVEPRFLHLKSDADLPPPSVIFGSSRAMHMVQERLAKVAETNIPVLITGESGTGKEIIAKMLHRLSPWNEGPFVKVNCPAIPGTLLESELFGYERGAFTGAYGSKPGRVEMAHRGSLFLDEIAELDHSLQAKLLQVLQDGQFCRIGAREDKRVECRVICATNRRLQDEIEAGNFREDLYYRINVLNLEVPPLRERQADIPQLVDYFLEVYNIQFSRQTPPLPSSVIELMRRQAWPGNIRQLENLAKRYVILGAEEALIAELLEAPAKQLKQEIPLDGSLSMKEAAMQAAQEVERRMILQNLQRHGWNRKMTARALKISYRALLYKIQQAGFPQKINRRSASAAVAPANNA